MPSGGSDGVGRDDAGRTQRVPRSADGRTALMTAVKQPSRVAPMAAWSVLDHATSGFTILDETARILYVNPANAQLAGWDRDALIGQSVGIFLPPEFREGVPGLPPPPPLSRPPPGGGALLPPNPNTP